MRQIQSQIGLRFKKIQRLISRPDRRRRTPTLLQMEAVECGAAALGIILGYYDRIVPLAELRQACGVSRDGSKASNIINAARSYGLQAKGFKVDLAGLRKLQCPYIVFWNFNHFLIVEGFAKDKVYLNDPATGPRTVSFPEFDQSFTGVVLVGEPSAEFQPGGRKPSLTLSLWDRLQSSLGALIYCVIAGLLLVIPGLAIPAFSQAFVDNVLIEGRSDWLRPLILGMILTAILNGFLTLLQLQFLRRMKIKLAVGMSSRFLWHILRLPVSFYDQRFAGEISSRVRLNDSLANLLSGRLATTVISGFTVVFYALVMLQYDVVLTAIGIAFVIVNVSVWRWVSRQRVDANLRLMQEQGKVSGVAISGLQSMETLKASGLESEFFSRWAGYYAKAINARQEMDATNQNLGVLPSFLTSITSMLLLAVGGLRVMDGVLSIGMLIAFQALMQRFLEPVNNLVSLAGELQEMEGNLGRLDDVLRNAIDPAVEQDISLSLTQSAAANVRLQGYVELRNITFGYNRSAPPLIENFSLSLKPGQRVALVGGSGSGKSTVAKLVCGLYEPWAGEILFDGQSRKFIPRSILTNSIALVEQDISLFAGTVRDNLTLWDSTVPFSNLVRACKDAAIQDVVLSMPGGYNADLAEGAANLSGGQRQRLEIARTLVNNPAILVMDEATSALDAEAEKTIDQKLRERGCTCVIVAHRLSTIRDCDEIIVFDRGKVVQRGSHEELQQVEGKYLQLIRSEGEAVKEE
ncbi:MAG: NHLP family bacteriocin export ABC transporter peptidase/permease/ATPase subunit [Nostoc sp. NMS1]|uniref:NHLP family bacteriocin export ABC transporter peptidase/permease/ATPase subunit n=1 Tax=unclassified Nostoc TaxID=2593658 RepID=UPI0025D50ACB|nr:MULTISPECIES: NHLP family bacteriocin export ABC transporter peptidase/permease/ATPase subunit [unclassified Nostoc]MBN3907034.1 NHLP family bacteriocin export ABC transporter peptidase/permease/ATPase subunit [Nostoc sp. NMS1]MBN3992078.1 NHLP family bacteriocin export ABC transporter peptidase/permease/ATPase subunit [Nostoc sp. NMS2]